MTVQGLIRRNRKLHKPSEFYTWLLRTYAASISIGVRRQVDEDGQSESFVRFLRSLKGSVGLISRQHYRGLFPADQRTVADRGYDKLVGKGRQRLALHRIDREINTLKRRSCNLVSYADKVIAHADRTTPASIPRFREVGYVLDYLEALLQRYYLLFRASNLMLGVRFTYDWQAPFRVAWLKPRSLPKRLHPTARRN